MCDMNDMNKGNLVGTTVYVVLHHWFGQGDNIMSVFKDKRHAEGYMRKLEKEYRQKKVNHEFYIEEWVML